MIVVVVGPVMSTVRVGVGVVRGGRLEFLFGEVNIFLFLQFRTWINR